MVQIPDTLHLKNHKQEVRLALLFIAIYAICNIIYGFVADGTWDDDCVVRYYNVQNAWNDPIQFISIWNRPLFSIIFFLPLQLGKYSILFGMVLITSLSSWALFKSAILLKLKHAWLLVPFFTFQVFFYGVSRNALTEPLSVALLCFGLLFLLQKKWLPFAIAGALMPLARLELSVLLIFWVIPLFKEKKFKYIIILGIPTLLVNIAGMAMQGDPLWLLHKTFGANNDSNRYGHTTFGHYFQRYIYVIGPIVFYFFLLGLLAKVVTRKISGFIFGQMVVGFMLYVIFSWKLNMGNAAGFLRNLIPLTPLAAIIALKGHNTWIEALHRDRDKNSVIDFDDSKEAKTQITANLHRQLSNKERKLEVLKAKKLISKSPVKVEGSFKHIWIVLYSIFVVAICYLLFSFVLRGHHKLVETENSWLNFYMIAGILSLFILLLIISVKKNLSNIIILTANLILAVGTCAFTLFEEPPNSHMNPERIAMGEVSDLYVGSYLQKQELFCNHSWFFWANDLPFYPEDYKHKRVLTKENIEAAPDSSIIIWENHYSQRLSGNVPLNYFDTHKQFVMLFRRMSSDKTILINIYQKTGKDSVNALKYQNNFLAHFPNVASGYFTRGTTKQQQGNLDESIADFTKTIALDSGFIDAYFNRGIAYFGQKKYDIAVKDFKQTTVLKPDYPQGWFNLGAAFSNIGNQDSAFHAYSKCVEFKKDYWEAYLNIANILLQKKDYKNASLQYQNVLQLQPTNLQASANRAQCLVNMEDWQNAVSEFNRIVTLQPNNTGAYYNRGLAYTNLKQYKNAVADYQKVIQQQPNFAAVWYNLGVAFLDMGKNEQACQQFRHALSLGYTDAKKAIDNACGG